MVSEGDDEVPVDQFVVSRLERHNGRQKLPDPAVSSPLDYHGENIRLREKIFVANFAFTNFSLKFLSPETNLYGGTRIPQKTSPQKCLTNSRIPKISLPPLTHNRTVLIGRRKVCWQLSL